jgi:hypothetical protein
MATSVLPHHSFMLFKRYGRCVKISSLILTALLRQRILRLHLQGCFDAVLGCHNWSVSSSDNAVFRALSMDNMC